MFGVRDGNPNQDIAGSLNCFITLSAETGGIPGGTVLGYYSNGGSYNQDWVVLKKTEVNFGKSNTAAHEFGHFFSLKHTFLGWESQSYDFNKDGACAPLITPSGRPTEKVPRTGPRANCSLLDVGDMLCDTEADYNEGYNLPATCSYANGVAQDPDCVKLETDPENIMSYFNGCGTSYKFTTQQKNVIQNNYNSSKRKYIKNTPAIIDSNEVINKALLLSPGNASTMQSISNVKLDWEDVPNATKYVIEMDRASTFDVEPFYFTSTISEVMIPSLAANRMYSWRVIGYNDVSFCAPLSNVWNFRTGSSSLVPLPFIQNLSIFPNPITNRTLKFTLDISESFEGNLKVTDLLGRVLYKENKIINQGKSLNTIETNNLVNGTYILTLENEKGINYKKFEVVE